MKTDRIAIRITPELKAHLGELALKDGRSVANYITQLLERHVSFPQGGRRMALQEIVDRFGRPPQPCVIEPALAKTIELFSSPLKADHKGPTNPRPKAARTSPADKALQSEVEAITDMTIDYKKARHKELRAAKNALLDRKV